ncbi:MAG: hypothetical protein AB7O97_02550 [Planctomycetota bacterium]
MRLVLLVLFSSTAVAGLTAQTTHLVGPSGLPQIRDALAIANDGDQILVEPGTYAQFHVQRSVTIRALVEGAVHVAINGTYATPRPIGSPACGNDPACLASTGHTVFELTGGRSAHVVGLDFVAGNLWPGLAPPSIHSVVVLGGAATFEDCTFAGAATTALAAHASRLHLMRCTARGANDPNAGIYQVARALAAVHCDVLAVDCSFTGRNPGGTVLDTAEAITLTGSSLHGSALQITGPLTGLSPQLSSALVADAGSVVWLSDSTVTAAAAACGIDAPGATGHLARVTVTPSVGCPMPPTGPLLGTSLPQALRTGGALTPSWTTEPFGFLALRLNTVLQKRVIPGIVEQPYWAEDAALGFGFFLADGNGQAGASWAIPNDPWFVGQQVWLHAFTLTATFPWQVAPPVGGLIR